MRLIEAQGYKCALTGCDLNPSNAQLDHKIPRSKGGSDSIENLQWILDTVNKAKGSMSNHEFFEMCNQVVLHFQKFEGSL